MSNLLSEVRGGKPSAPVTAPAPQVGSGSSLLSGVRATQKPKKKGSFVGNLVSDPYHAALGTGVMAYQTAKATAQDINAVTHLRAPTYSAKLLVKDVKALGADPFVQDIGKAVRHPLRESSIYAYATGGKQPKQSTVVAQVKEGHLFVPVLDALAIASFGSARVGALGAVGERAPGVTANQAIRKAIVRGHHSGPLKTITVVDSTTGKPIVTRTLPRNVYQAGRMKAVDNVLKVVTHEAERLRQNITGKETAYGSFPVVGESARAARAVEKVAKEVELAHKSDPRFSEYQKAFSRLDKNQRVALNVLGKVPLPSDMEGWKAILEDQTGDAAAATLKRLNDPKVMEPYLAGLSEGAKAKFVRAHDAAREVVQAREQILERRAALSTEAASAAAYGPSRVARGAEFKAETLPVDKATPVGTTVRVSGQKAEGKIAAVTGSRATVFYPRFGRSVTVPLTRLEQVKKPRLVGGGTPEQIASELETAGRPQPIYSPDITAGSRESRQAIGRSAGTTPAASPVKASQRILFRLGQVALHPDLLTPSFLKAVAYDANLAKHEAVLEIATPVAEGAGLPANMRWVRERRGEKIPYTLTSEGEHLAEVGKAFPEDTPLTVTEGEGPIAVDAQGRRLAISRALDDRLRAEVRREHRATKWFVQRPLDVWRALVLNLRIPWLINNIVGNNLLYALRFAGPDGLKAYVAMLSEPVKTMLFKHHVTKSGLTREDVAEIFPRQSRGTFIETQTPNSLGVGKLRKTVRVLGVGLAPLDRRTEQALRRTALNAVLRGSPEVRMIYKAMPKQTRSLREAMRRASKGDEDLRRLANTEADRSLGDYLSLAPAEQGALRRLVPFYGWYREIARIAAHAVVDTPVRVALLANLGILEEQLQEDKRGPFPSFLEGSAARGLGPGGTMQVVQTRPANPFSTVADEILIAQTLAGGGDRTRAGANAALGILNPFAAGAGEWFVNKAKGDSTDLGYQGGVAGAIGSHGGPLGAMAGSVFGGLPQVQLISPPAPSKLYPTRSRRELELRLLYDLRRNVAQAQAAYYNSQGK